MQALRLIVPIVSANKFYAGMHWTKRNKISKDIHEIVYYECKHQKIKAVRSFPTQITYEFRLTRMNRDLDNLGILVKMINDGLKVARIIPDDTLAYVNRITLEAHHWYSDVVYVHLV